MDRSIRDEDQKAARTIANAAIDRLGPNDIGAVLYTGRVSRKYSQGLTADRARLHAAADLVSIGELQAAPGTASLAAAIASHGAPQQVDQLERAAPLASEERSGECDCGNCVILSLTALANSLAGATGRQKSILFVGSDIAIASTVAEAGGRCAAFIYPARDRLTRALDAANVTFHVVDPHGLDAREGISFRVQSLAVLPDYTGGRAVVNVNNPQDSIGSIFDESRSYYVLAVARDPATAAHQHQIKITVKRSGAVVQARNLYYDADPKAGPKPAPDAVGAALNELLPGGDFSLQMNLVPQFAADGSPEVRVLLGAESAIAGKLDVVIATYDRVFTPVGTPLKQGLDIPPGTVAANSTFQWTTVLKPPPGDFEVRAAVATADGKRAANVIGYVDVPDVKKADVALSGIVVKSRGAATLRRAFDPGEPVIVSFQAARGKAAHGDLEVRYRLTNDVGQALAEGDVPRGASGKGLVEPYDLALRMPESSGEYVLAIAAAAGTHTVRRELPVTVR
jgi:hypothetical protein